jgi:hypothetical protein
MSSNDFDPTPYLRPPLSDVPAGIALGVALLGAMPKNAPDGVRKAATKLRMATVGLQDAWSRSGRSASPGELKLADIAIDSAWSALHARLDAYAALPTAYWPKAERAAELIAEIFPDGLAFLSLPYTEEWAAGEDRLRKINLEGLADDIDEIAGPEFLAEVRRAQKCYGSVLELGAGAEHRPGIELSDPLRALGRAISNYALQVIATADGTTSSLWEVRQSLKPIDDLRPAPSRRSSTPGIDRVPERSGPKTLESPKMAT